MGKIWSVGIFWGIIGWIPYFIDLPLGFIIRITLGLPVIFAGYISWLMEVFFYLPEKLIFSISLFCGIFLTYLITEIINFVSYGKLLTLSKRSGANVFKNTINNFWAGFFS